MRWWGGGRSTCGSSLDGSHRRRAALCRLLMKPRSGSPLRTTGSKSWHSPEFQECVFDKRDSEDTWPQMRPRRKKTQRPFVIRGNQKWEMTSIRHQPGHYYVWPQRILFTSLLLDRHFNWGSHILEPLPAHCLRHYYVEWLHINIIVIAPNNQNLTHRYICVSSSSTVSLIDWSWSDNKTRLGQRGWG